MTNCLQQTVCWRVDEETAEYVDGRRWVLGDVGVGELDHDKSGQLQTVHSLGVVLHLLFGAMPAVSEQFDDERRPREMTVNPDGAIALAREHCLRIGEGDVRLTDQLEKSTFEPAVPAPRKLGPFDDIEQRWDAVAPAGA